MYKNRQLAVAQFADHSCLRLGSGLQTPSPRGRGDWGTHRVRDRKENPEVSGGGLGYRVPLEWRIGVYGDTVAEWGTPRLSLRHKAAPQDWFLRVKGRE